MADPLNTHMTHRVDDKDGITTVICQCSCGSAEAIALPTRDLEAYLGGALAQRAMRTLSPDQRERIITGTCGPCWDAMFPEEDDDAPLG